MQRKIKQAIPLLLVLAMLVACVPMGMAAEEQTSGTVPVTIMASAPTFSVTVPTTLPIHMDVYGGITCGDITITNNSSGPVLVEDTQIAALNGWTLADYATTTFTDANKGQHRAALQLNRSNGLTASGSDTNEDFIPAGGGRQTISAAAKIPYQGVNAVNTNIAQIVFVLGWNKVVIPMTGLTITGGDSADVGSTIQLSATKVPENTSDTGAISWSSSDTSVATVTSDGIVTGKSAGTAVITASCNGIVTTKDIIVVDPHLVTDIELRDSWGGLLPENGTLEFQIYGYKSYSAHVIPESALDGKSITISSNNNNVAYRNGPSSIYVTGNSGTVTITVSCGSFSKTFEFEVGHWS